MAFSFHHAAITTHRYHELLSFYTELLGAALERETSWQQGQVELDARTGLKNSEGRVAVLSLGAAKIEIFEFKHPSPPDRPATTLAHKGLTHIALSCEDCVAEYTRLKAAGMKFNAEPWLTPAGGIFTFGNDPDGNIIEILQPAPSAR